MEVIHPKRYKKYFYALTPKTSFDPNSTFKVQMLHYLYLWNYEKTPQIVELLMKTAEIVKRPMPLFWTQIPEPDDSIWPCLKISMRYLYPSGNKKHPKLKIEPTHWLIHSDELDCWFAGQKRTKITWLIINYWILSWHFERHFSIFPCMEILKKKHPKTSRPYGLSVLSFLLLYLKIPKQVL